MASGMLVMATFAVGSMVAAYASASNTASPRSFSLVISDDSSQKALSAFVGAFIFSTVARLGSPKVLLPRPNQRSRAKMLSLGVKTPPNAPNFLSHLGPKPIPRSAFTESRLTAALENCLSDPGIRQAAKNWGLNRFVKCCCYWLKRLQPFGFFPCSWPGKGPRRRAQTGYPHLRRFAPGPLPG